MPAGNAGPSGGRHQSPGRLQPMVKPVVQGLRRIKSAAASRFSPKRGGREQQMSTSSSTDGVVNRKTTKAKRHTSSAEIIDLTEPQKPSSGSSSKSAVSSSSSSSSKASKAQSTKTAAAAAEVTQAPASSSQQQTNDLTEDDNRETRANIESNINNNVRLSESMTSSGAFSAASGASASSKQKKLNNKAFGMSNLDKKKLESVKEIKNSIKEMRINRRKVKFDEHQQKRPQERQVGSSSLSSARLNLEKNRFGEITMNDLGIAFLKKEQQQLLHEEIVEAGIQQQINKIKKQIRRTSQEVLTDREQIESLQQRNWAVRKRILQSDAPRETVTALNLKIEKLVREERELDTETEQLREQKRALDEERAEMTVLIGRIKDLLDELNAKVVPLLPEEDLDPAMTLSPIPSQSKGLSALDTSYSDSIDSTAGMDAEVAELAYLAAASKNNSQNAIKNKNENNNNNNNNSSNNPQSSMKDNSELLSPA